MPELPEVETTVRLLRRPLEGRVVTGVTVEWPRTLWGSSARNFESGVVGARIARLWRRGKFLVADLERGSAVAGWLVGHLRMTGRMVVEPAAADPGPWRKVTLALDDGAALHFLDVRKFGRFTYTSDLDSLLGELGPEPLEDEFSARWLADALRSRQRLLKPLLLDQTFVAGLGNIYVDESLHRAGLHPLTSSRRVPGAGAERLHAAIRSVLSEAIVREGSSFDAFYRTPNGEAGSFQDEFRVYGRDGEACGTCGATIVRIVVGQRGTHLCPSCQGRGPRRRRLTASRGPLPRR